MVFTTATTGTMYPLDQIAEQDTRLGAFFWAEAERPRRPSDIFLHPDRTERPKQGAVSAAADDEEEEQEEAVPRSKKRRK